MRSHLSLNTAETHAEVRERTRTCVGCEEEEVGLFCTDVRFPMRDVTDSAFLDEANCNLYFPKGSLDKYMYTDRMHIKTHKKCCTCPQRERVDVSL